MKTDCHKGSLIMAIGFLVGLNVAIAGAASSPNFAGRWTINVQKSEFGMLFAPKTEAVKITQRGIHLKISDAATNAQDETKRTQSALTVNGQQCTVTLIATPYSAMGALSWKDGSLTFDGSGSSSGVDFQVKETWALSTDKRTITIIRHFTSARGNTDQTVVLEK